LRECLEDAEDEADQSETDWLVDFGDLPPESVKNGFREVQAEAQQMCERRYG
jgi:hypothetical protein